MTVDGTAGTAIGAAVWGFDPACCVAHGALQVGVCTAVAIPAQWGHSFSFFIPGHDAQPEVEAKIADTKRPVERSEEAGNPKFMTCIRTVRTTKTFNPDGCIGQRSNANCAD